MKVVQEIECKTHVSASLNEAGDLSIKMFGVAEYAPGRETTAEVGLDELPAETRARVQDALDEAIREGQKAIGPRIARSIHKSAEVAASFGEI